jgi:hypothetical protein
MYRAFDNRPKNKIKTRGSLNGSKMASQKWLLSSSSYDEATPIVYVLLVVPSGAERGGLPGGVWGSGAVPSPLLAGRPRGRARARGRH